MDLNHLYHHHQLSLMLADAAVSEPSRLAHLEAAGRYARKIEAERGRWAGRGLAAEVE